MVRRGREERSLRGGRTRDSVRRSVSGECLRFVEGPGEIDKSLANMVVTGAYLLSSLIMALR
jgi:hypothetical protein